MKKLLSFLLALVMVMALLPLSNMTVYAESATSGDCGATASDNVTWEVTKSSGSEVYDTLTISGTGAMKDYSSNNENPTPWLAYTNSISKVVINDGVTTIGEYAFFYFYNLNSITIPNSVKTIGKGAVQFCEKLISITIPNSVTTIGGCAFGGCSALTSITIPSSVTSISDEAFTGCTGLTSVEFKGTSTNVGAYAFWGVGTSGGTSNPTLTLPEGWTGTAAPTDNTTAWCGGYFAGSPSTDIKDCTCEVADQTYTGSAIEPAVTVKDGETTLAEGTEYTVEYSNNINVGTATVTVTGKGDYTGTITKTFTIKKASQRIQVVVSPVTLKTTDLAKAAKVVSPIKVKNAKGTLTYKLYKANKGAKKYLEFDAATGKVTVKKGTPKGTYRIRVMVTAKSTENYKAKTRKAVVEIVVK